MGRIVIAWELGGGLGHIQYDLPLAKILLQRGHEVVCIMKDVIDSGRILDQHSIRIMQAPVWQVYVKKLENTYNYAETLFNHGYLVKDGLSCMAKSWRNLFNFINPDLLIADHAPTALIAARGQDIKTILYGTGFFAPPHQSPMPSIIPWKKPPEGLLEYSEKEAVRIINQVLTELGAPELHSLSDLFAVDDNILATFKELDHYQTREETKYWGPVLNLPEGGKPEWPTTGHSKKIFCYLKPTYPNLEEVLSSLQRIEAAVIVFLPKAPKEISEKFQSANIKFEAKLLNMAEVCKESDLVICHAGHGTVAATLLHRKPLLLLPEHNQLEQVLTAWNITRQKMGLMIYTTQEHRDYRGAVDRILSEASFTRAAEKFARKYRDFDPEKQLGEIADRCEEIISVNA